MHKMKKIKLTLFTALSCLLASTGVASSSFLHAPHDDAHGVACIDCHEFSMTDTASWGAPQVTIDDTVKNFICLKCHGPAGNAPTKAMHSDLSLNGTATWTTECVDCHSPHFQRQLHSIADLNLDFTLADMYLVTGTITGITPAGGNTTVSYTLGAAQAKWSDTATWSAKTGAGRGLIFVADASNPKGQTFETLSADATTITVMGSVDAAMVNKEFGLLYGQFIRTQIDNNLGGQAVTFFNPYGGYVDDTGSVVPNGICQVCHTQTLFWTNIGQNETHNAQSRCTLCHEAAQGFKFVGHDHTLTLSSSVGCVDCHTNNDVEGQVHFGNCDTCHSSPRQEVIDAIAAGTGAECTTCHVTDFTTIHTAVLLTPDTIHNTIVTTGTTSCASCHNDPPPLVDPLDPKIHNACISCHGGTNGTLSSRAAGVTAPGNCATCHTETFDVIHPGPVDHSSLVTASGTTCINCHTSTALVDANDPKVHNDCTSCHNVNGGLLSIAQGKSFSVGGNCTTCHGTYFPNHSHHNGTSNDVSYNPALDTSQASQQGCADCHTDYDNVNGTTLGLGTWQTILVEHDLDGTKDGSTNTCDNCHAYDGIGTAPQLDVQNAIANGNAATCATCHTDKVPAADHGVPTSGKHNEHLALSGVSCSSCHGNIPYFKTGTDSNGDGLYNLSETDVCYTCHQEATGNPITEIKNGWTAPGTGFDCSSCHAVTPGTGSHTTHLAFTDCASCHDSAVANTTAPVQHLDGNIDVYDATPGDLGYPADKTIASAYSTCSTAYCHGIGTPQWGGTVACGDCHAVNNTLAGNHGAHYSSSINASSLSASNDSTATEYIFNCGVCHDTSNASYMGHATGPVNSDPAHNQTAEVYFDAVIAGSADGSGWVTGATAGIDPAGFPWTDQECGNIYCHSAGTKNAAPYEGAYSTPNWVSGFSGECNECHRGDALTLNTLNTGSHYQHLYGDDWTPPVKNKLTCDRCHDATASDNRTIKDKSFHVNRSVNIAFDSASDPQGIGEYVDTATHTVDLTTKNPGTASGDCSNTYCHSQGTQVTAPYPAPNYVNPTWGMEPGTLKHPDATTEACTGCHGGYEPLPLGIDTNAHQAHIENIDAVGTYIGCSWCHRATKSTGMRIETYENHVNSFVEIKFKNDPAEGGRFLDTDGPTYAGQNTAGPDSLNDFARVVPDPATKFDCSNVYCHSNGNLAANVDNVIIDNGQNVGEGALADPATAFKTIEWNSTSQISCDGCHGDGAGNAHPTYANGGPATVTANSHEKHVVEGLLNCTLCHQETLTDTSIPPTGGLIDLWPEKHLNRLEDVKISSLAGTIPDAYEAEGPKTCTAVYCHSNGTEVATGTINKFPLLVWGGAGMTCDSCHNTTGSGPNYVNGTPKANSHAAHFGFNCGTCHSGTTSDGSTITDPSKHTNQVYDVEAGNGESFSYSFASTGGTCSNISCHGGTDAAWGTSASHTIEVGPNDLSYDPPGTPCSSCHVVANWSEIEGIEHNVATNGAGSCATCHNSPRQEVIDTIALGATPIHCLDCHSDKDLTPHGSVDHVALAYVTLGTTSCANCHDPGGAANSTVSIIHKNNCSHCHTTVPALQPGIPAGGGDCYTCHGSDVQTVHPSCTTCHAEPPNGTTSPNTEGAHTDHAALGFGSASTSCVACHDGATHLNGTADVSILANFNAQSGAASSNGSTCSNTRCHGGQTSPAWSTGSINVDTDCTSCHDQRNGGSIPNQYNDYLSGKHDKHVRGEGFACTECHNPSRLATGHFSNLETTSFEWDPQNTIGGDGTSLPDSGWSINYMGRVTCSISCHGENHNNDNW